MMTLKAIEEAIDAAFKETIEKAELGNGEGECIEFDKFDLECLRLLVLDKIKIRSSYP